MSSPEDHKNVPYRWIQHVWDTSIRFQSFSERMISKLHSAEASLNEDPPSTEPKENKITPTYLTEAPKEAWDKSAFHFLARLHM